MDWVLDKADEYAFDSAYAMLEHSARPFMDLSPLLMRDNILRQYTSLFLITASYGFFFYFSFASLSYHFTFDKSLMQHPKFLKQQIRQEIKLTLQAFAPIALMTAPWFVLEVRGYSLLYSDIEAYGWAYTLFSMVLFLFFTDMMIYWVHRGLHHPLVYAKIHKPHHKWIVPTPFASHAFHPMDGYAQSLAYHVFVFLFPMHKFVYLFMFLFVNVWTISIHDGEYLTQHPYINGAAHHTLHHLYFNYNYGQYFTLWDRLGGTFRQPSERQYNRGLKSSLSNRKQEAIEVEEIMKDKVMKETSVEYMVDSTALKED